jgi:FtsP/CotA-like multicopper oxidase with cupredoxin domain
MERHARDPERFGPERTEGNWLHRETVQRWDREGKIVRNLEDPPLKDTVAVPDGGFVVLRFWADNPGYWLFHCHIEWHEHVGMGVIIQVVSGAMSEDSSLTQNVPF